LTAGIYFNYGKSPSAERPVRWRIHHTFNYIRFAEKGGDNVIFQTNPFFFNKERDRLITIFYQLLKEISPSGAKGRRELICLGIVNAW
jgi:hypothetical protein